MARMVSVRKWMPVVAVLALLLSVVGVVGPQVGAADAAGGGGALVAEHSGKCLDVDGWSQEAGANVIQWDCHGGANQLFELVPSGGGFLVRSVHSGKCLDVDAWSQDNGANVLQWDCHGGANQVVSWQGSSLRFAHSGKCLDVDAWSQDSGANLIQWDCGGGANQRFTFGDGGRPPTTTTTAPPNTTSTTTVGRTEPGSVVVAHSGLCLDIAGPRSSVSGRSLIQVTCDGEADQLFSQEPVDGGFMLRSALSGKCIDVDRWSQDNGANVLLWDCLGGANQVLSWQGSSLRFAHSGKCLDVDAWSQDSGANVIQWDCGGGANQQFRMTPGEVVDSPGGPEIVFYAKALMNRHVEYQGVRYSASQAEIDHNIVAYTQWLPQAIHELTDGVVRLETDYVVNDELVVHDGGPNPWNESIWTDDVPNFKSLLNIETGDYGVIHAMSPHPQQWAWAGGFKTFDGLTFGSTTNRFVPLNEYGPSSWIVQAWVHEWLHIIDEALYINVFGADSPCVHCGPDYNYDRPDGPARNVSQWHLSWHSDLLMGRVPVPGENRTIGLRSYFWRGSAADYLRNGGR